MSAPFKQERFRQNITRVSHWIRIAVYNWAHTFIPLQYPLNLFISYKKMSNARLDFQQHLKTVANSNECRVMESLAPFGKNTACVIL